MSRLFGWTVEVDVPDYPKCVICVAPHTSNWDFFIGKLAYLSIGRYAGFMMKKEWFFPPLGSLLKSMGGVRMFCEIIRYIPSEVLYTWTYSFKLWRGTYPQTAIRRDRNY